jgi:hypothetical protein
MKLNRLAWVYCLLFALALCLCPITLRADSVLVGAAACQLPGGCMPMHPQNEWVHFTLTTTSYADSLWIDAWSDSQTPILLELTGNSTHLQWRSPKSPFLPTFSFSDNSPVGVGQVLPAGNYTIHLDALNGVIGANVAWGGTYGCCGFISGVTGDGGMPVFQLNGSPVSSTPEPSTLLMLGSGVLGVAGVLRRRLTR